MVLEPAHISANAMAHLRGAVQKIESKTGCWCGRKKRSRKRAIFMDDDWVDGAAKEWQQKQGILS